MTRPMLLSVAAAAALVIAAVYGYVGQPEAVRQMIGTPMAAMALAGVFGVGVAYANALKLQNCEREVGDQEKQVAAAGAAIDELHGTIERQLQAIEETAASLHQMTAS